MNEYGYQKPRFDAFIEFKPSKAFLQDVLRELRSQSAALTQDQQGLPEWADWVKEELKQRQKPIISRIKQIQYRLKSFERTGSWEAPKLEGRITDQDIAKAKEVPITNFYDGRLKPAGKNRMMGSCLWHTDNTPSFVIYLNQNSFSCYSCNVSGDVITFIRKQQNLDFIGAIKFLLNK